MSSTARRRTRSNGRRRCCRSTSATGRSANEIAGVVARFRFSAGFGRTLSKLIRRGIGVHHAGMLPRYRRLVERLSQAGLLSVICGTDTLGVGINVPIRTVLFTTLAKYDGHKVRIVTARAFHQIAGRAGRAGFDTLGYVEVQAPEHLIANEKALAKAGDDPKARRKVIRKQAPAGTASYNRETFDRLVAAPPEPLRSRMQVTYSMVLDVVSRPGNPVETLRRLLMDNHEEPASQRRLVRRALAIGRSLLRAGIVVPLPEPDATGRTHRLTVDLQRDFALNQPLSAFALAVVDVLDPDSPEYALDLVSVIEATLEDPLQVLLAQQFEARGEAVRQMKDDGIEYEERMELIDGVTWPAPLAELLEHTLKSYRQSHPWLPDALRPKSVVRDLYERGLTFTEYVAHYRLARVEGVLLRYLSDAYRALRRTVPAASRDETFSDLVEWLGELVAPDRLVAGRRVGVAARRARAGRSRRGVRTADHRERTGVPGARAQRDVPGGSSSWAATTSTASWRLRSWRRAPPSRRSRSSWDAPRGTRRSTRTTPSTTPSVSGLTPAGPVSWWSRSWRDGAGRCGRSSTTRPGTTTGRSSPRSTSTRATRPATSSCAFSRWSASTDLGERRYPLGESTYLLEESTCALGYRWATATTAPVAVRSSTFRMSPRWLAHAAVSFTLPLVVAVHVPTW